MSDSTSSPTISINIEEIYRQEKQRWLKTEAPRKSLADVFGQITPYFIIVVFLAAYALSSPHTASVLNMLTPGVGWVAPVMVELAIIYTAFEGKRAALFEIPPSGVVKFLSAFMFTIAVITNLTGALYTVIVQVGLQTLSGEQLIAKFGGLPVTTQSALIMVVLMALVVPIVCEVAGHGIAGLAFEYKRGDNFNELRWQEVHQTILYRAVFVRYVATGLPTKEARDRTLSEVKGYLFPGASLYKQLPEPKIPQISTENLGNTEQSAIEKPQDKLAKGEAKRRLDAILRDDPRPLREIPIDELMAKSGAAKSAVYAWRKDKIQQIEVQS